MARLIFVTGTPSSVAEGSGTSVSISGLRNALAALGQEVVMVTPATGRTTTPSRLVFNIRLRKQLRSMRADAVVGFDLDGVFAPRGGAVHVAAIKGVLADEARHERGIARVALMMQSWLEARHVRRADRVITSSAYSAGRIATFYGLDRAKVAVVPELIDLDAWDRALAAAPREEGPPRILAVAHLYPRKGVDTLLRAFASVTSDAVLRIAGIGPERPRLEHLARGLGISGRVHFLGHLPLRELMTEYRNASVFALPSEQEGFGIVFLEAMASALPVVALRAGAVPEVVADRVTALLVDSGDEAGLADALEGLLSDPALRARLGNAGRERVTRFAAPHVARQFLSAVGMADP